MPKKTTVAVVDDHPLVRRGLRETFAEEANFEVIAEGASANDAIRICREQAPDLLLLDITMPGGGIEAASEIAKSNPKTAIAMLSIREDVSVVRAALKAGARGYISKGVDSADLVEAAKRVLGGERYVSPELGARLIAGDEDDRRPRADVERSNAPEFLTTREQEILELLGDGLSNQEIADRLGLSENTIKHYMTPLLHKLGARNRTEAALLANKRKK